ncbi:T9SS type A sorting domain-containing protein [Dokdonia pacifica]|uniref:Por secretion system C-terminal sorting domain-containing protein n=1 Tax=Dokdonia pacifica TaxID=1627892 RepID=A0A239BEU0_9FLAO|nr:T9SS type A sorting domain-containing protein [Dokdonia pacifica]SNS06142.1 Por secretion system C-terminal sorting domain-containing protein [Dokdonia pacifica]
MKKITLLLFLLCTYMVSYGQLMVDDTDTTPFEDISTTGTALGLTDDGEENIVIPFEFNLDGQISSDLRIGNNGGILYGVTEGDLFAGNLPLDGESPRIVPFWDDFDDETGDVYWEVRGTAPARRVIIQWEDRPHFPGQTEIDPATFQVVLFETTNDILFVYEDVFFDDPDFNYGQSASIGVVSETTVYQYAFNDPIPLDGISAIRYSLANETFTVCGPTGQVIDPDGSNEGDTVTSVITVAENGTIGNEFSIESLMLDITHTFVGDLDINLTSPMGTTLILSNENGGSGNNYTDTVFQDGGDPINATSAPFTGIFEPQGGTFADTFMGEEINGDWTLTIIDVFSSSEAGTLDNFCMTFVSFAILCPEDVEVVNNPSIVPVGVTTTYTPGFGTLPEALIDGSGLSEFPSVDATHDDTSPGNSFVSENEVAGSFDFDLGGTFMLNGVAIWNQNNGGPGVEGEPGIQEIVLSSSLDGTNFTVIPNGPTLVSQVIENGPIGPEQFGFMATEAAFIRLEVISNYGDDDAGFAEIAFVGTACDAIATFDFPTATGTSNTPVQTAGLESGDLYPAGTTTNSYEVEGNDGSILSCSFNVTILDETQPFFIGCPGDFEVNQEGNSTVPLDDFTATVSASDNCSEVTITQDPIAGTILDQNTVQTVTLTATDESGNESICTFDITVLSSLSVDDETLEDTISIYPNPAKDIVTLTYTGIPSITQMSVIDMNGRILQSIPTNNNFTERQIDISNYASGIYFVRIETATSSTVKRIIKQ